MIHLGGGERLWTFHTTCSYFGIHCPLLGTIGVCLSIACHYRRIFVQCLSLSAYICPMLVTIGVCLSNAWHDRRIFVQCLSLSAHICPMPVRNHRKRYNSQCFSMVGNSSPEPAGTLRNFPQLGEVSHLLQFGTSSTRAGGQDDVSSNKLPQITFHGDFDVRFDRIFSNVVLIYRVGCQAQSL